MSDLRRVPLLPVGRLLGADVRFAPERALGPTRTGRVTRRILATRTAPTRGEDD